MMRFLWVLGALAWAAGCSEPSSSGVGVLLGAEGDSCTRTPDCRAGLRCVALVCILASDQDATGGDVSPAEDVPLAADALTDAGLDTQTDTGSDAAFDTGADTATDTGADMGDADVTEDVRYYAVIVDDRTIFPNHRRDGQICNTASAGAHGADIDAIEIYDGDTLLSSLGTVRYAPGALCVMAAEFSNPYEATGAPNGSVSERYVSLGGGWLAGEFLGGIGIRSGNTIVVYEVGSSLGGLDEGYELYVAPGLDCVEDGDACRELVGDAFGEQEFGPF